MSSNRSRTGLGKSVDLRDENGNGGAGFEAVDASTIKIIDDSDNAADLEAKDITISGTLSGATKAMVGLTSADDTSDANKPVSTAGQTALDLKANLSLLGANDGIAELDSAGKVPAAQLPSYVDDVVEYANQAAFPATGESGKIYVALDNNRTYRWGGSAYAEISESLALGTTSSTAHRGDHGATAYTHSQATGNAHSMVPADINLGNVDNTSDVNKPVSTAQQTEIDTKADHTAPDFSGIVSIVNGKVELSNGGASDAKVTIEFDKDTGKLNFDKPVHIDGAVTTTGTVNGRTIASDGASLDASKWRKITLDKDSTANAVFGAVVKAGSSTMTLAYKITEEWDQNTYIEIGTASASAAFATIANVALQSGSGQRDIIDTYDADTQFYYKIVGSPTKGGIKLMFTTS